MKFIINNIDDHYVGSTVDFMYFPQLDGGWGLSYVGIPLDGSHHFSHSYHSGSEASAGC